MRINNHIHSAVGKLSQHKNLSHDCLITSDFGQICPVAAIPLLPRDKFTIRSSCFARIAPLIFPTYGRCKVVTNFHSVQYSQVWRDFDLFVSGNTVRGSHKILFPYISSDVIRNVFGREGIMYYKGDASAQNHEIQIWRPGSQGGVDITYAFLTNKGKWFRKVLNSLGYPFLSLLNFSPSNVIRFYSSLPLMSFLKIYCDFYQSRQYSDTSVLREILSELFNISSSSGNVYWTSADDGVQLSTSSLNLICDNLLLLYPSDYITSAQSAANIVGGSTAVPNMHSDNDLKSFYSPSTLIQSSKYNFFPSYVTGDGMGQINQISLTHRLLENFENLIRRYNLVGSREIDRIRSLFGIRPSVQRNQYSVFHGGFSSPLQIQDVTSTSANFNDSNYLGSYAGKGIVSNGDSISVQSDDFGILIGISYISVNPLYRPAQSREVMKTSMWSYYNPEFDHGYAQAVAKGEVQSPVENLNDNPDDIFGYQNAYDEYRQILSHVNGDFADQDLFPWTFLRENIGSSAQSNNVIYQPAPDGNDPSVMYNPFQRIFVDGSGRDHFYLYYSFDIDALRVVRTSSESFDLGVGDVSTSNNPAIK